MAIMLGRTLIRDFITVVLSLYVPRLGSSIVCIFCLVTKKLDEHYPSSAMAPSQLKIATDSLNRLVKEEASYHKELESQKKRIATLEQQKDDQDENREFKIKQEVSVTSPYPQPGDQARPRQSSVFSLPSIHTDTHAEESPGRDQRYLPKSQRTYSQFEREITSTAGIWW